MVPDEAQNPQGTTCPHCHGFSTSPVECSHCGIIFSKIHHESDESSELKNIRHASEGLQAEHPPAPLFDYGNYYTSRYTLPLALLLALISDFLKIPAFFVRSLTNVFFHEWGHTMVSWLGARPAIPILLPGFGFTQYTTLSRSNSVFVLMVIIYLAAAGICFRKKYYHLVGLAITFISLQFYFSIVAGDKQWLQTVIWAGNGGEMILATVAILSFYYPLPDKIRWDFFRFPALFAGVFSFVDALYRWILSVSDPKFMPWGSILSTAASKDGDLNRLQLEFGWTVKDMLNSYLRAGALCSIVIAMHYIFFATSTKKTERSEN